MKYIALFPWGDHWPPGGGHEVRPKQKESHPMKKIVLTLAVLALALAGSAQAGGNPTFGSGGVGAAKKACAASGGTWVSYTQVCEH